MMPDSTDVVDGPADDGADDDQGRTRLDRRNKKLADENKSLRDRLAKLEDAEAERQAEREKAETEAARKAGEWEKLEAKLQKRIEQLEASNQDWEAKDLARTEGEARSARERTFLDKIVAKCGTIPAARLRGLLREAAQHDGDLTLDPESPTEGDVKRAIKAMTELDPDSFSGRQTVGNTQGSPTPTKGGGLEEIRQRIEMQGHATEEDKAAYAQALIDAHRPA